MTPHIATLPRSATDITDGIYRFRVAAPDHINRSWVDVLDVVITPDIVNTEGHAPIAVKLPAAPDTALVATKGVVRPCNHGIEDGPKSIHRTHIASYFTRRRTNYWIGKAIAAYTASKLDASVLDA